MLKRLLILALLFPVYCFALSLGKMQTLSYLYQPVRAEIALNDIGTIPVNELQIGLASQSEFMRADMAKTNVVQELQFKLVQPENQTPYIAVTSTARINEPVVSFLVKVSWSQGDYIKKYILLLNPPPANSPPVVNITQTTETKAVQHEYPKLVDHIYGPTTSDETLWTVAQQVRPSKQLTLDQTMLALVEYNPNAFLLHNVNGLMSGYYLRIPSAAQIQDTSPNAAERQVRLHNRHWKNKTRVKITAKAKQAPSKPVIQPTQVVPAAPIPASAPAPATVEPQTAVSEPISVSNTQNQPLQLTEQATQTAVNADEIVSLRAELDAAIKENALFKQNNTELTQTLKTLTEKNTNLQAEVTAAKQTIQRLQQLLNGQASVSVKSASKSNGLIASLMKNWGIIIGVIVILLLIVWLIIRRKKNNPDDGDDTLFNDVPLGDDDANIKAHNKIDVPEELNHSGLDLDTQTENHDSQNTTIHVTKAEKESNNDDLNVDQLLPDVTVTQVHRHNSQIKGKHTNDILTLLQEAKLYVDYGRTDQAKELLTQAIMLENITALQWEELLRIIVETADKQLFGRAVAKIPAGILNADEQALWQTIESLRANFISSNEQPTPVITKTNASIDDKMIDELTLSPLSEEETVQLSNETEESNAKPASTHDEVSEEFILKFTDDEPNLDIEKDNDNDKEPDPHDILAGENSDMSKLDLIRAYVEMGDTDAAKKLLHELIKYGKSDSKKIAEKILQDL